MQEGHILIMNITVFTLQIVVNDDGNIYKWKNSTHPQTLTQVQSSKVYVNSYVDIFILNVNESHPVLEWLNSEVIMSKKIQ